MGFHEVSGVLDENLIDLHPEQLETKLSEPAAGTLEVPAVEPTGDRGAHLHIRQLNSEDFARSSPELPHVGRAGLRDQQLDECRCIEVQPQPRPSMTTSER